MWKISQILNVLGYIYIYNDIHIYIYETRSMLWMLQEEVVVCNAFSDKNETRRNDVKSKDVLPGLVLAQAELCNLLDWDKEKRQQKRFNKLVAASHCMK